MYQVLIVVDNIRILYFPKYNKTIVISARFQLDTIEYDYSYFIFDKSSHFRTL